METPAILQALELTSWWEVPAVVLAILYLVLAARENIWCWGAAFVSTAIYIYVFFDVNLFLESALQIYYLAMAVYGWYQWRQPTEQSATLPISTWSLKKHVVVIAVTGAIVVTSGYLLSKNTEAALPYVDAFTTWYAVVTTYMVTKKILENWVYWFVIDSVSVYLYYSRGLYLTALLFIAYLVIIVFGYLKWKKEYDQANVQTSREEELSI
ncbi:MAG: nicotinamide riboside transporter PnuC [Gemmatimonadota bacterium]|nr:nicotinamide riboside transporter PnuC [Gemmatimonadota bacterium]